MSRTSDSWDVYAKEQSMHQNGFPLRHASPANQEDGIPEDAAGLAKLQPMVEVDEDGVGTVSVGMAIWVGEQPATNVAPVQEGADSEINHNNDLGVADRSAEQPWSEQPVAGPSAGDPVLGEKDTWGDEPDDPVSARQTKVAGNVWEPATLGHTGAITALAVSPDNLWVASGSTDTMVILWDTEDGTVVRKWESHDHIVWHLAFSPDSSRIASAGGDGRVMVWDVDSGELLGTLEGHMKAVYSVVWSPDGSKLASASDDTTVRIWDGESYACLHTLARECPPYLYEGTPRLGLPFVLFSHDGQYLTSGGVDCSCRVWNVESGTLHKELAAHWGAVWAASFDPEDKRIATASDDGTVMIWDIETGEDSELVALRGHEGPVWVVAFSPDGTRVLSGSSDSTLKVWDASSGERVTSLNGHHGTVNAASFSPDGHYVASASSDHTVRLWRLPEGACVRTFDEHNDKVMHVLFSQNGLTLSSGSEEGGTARVHSLKDIFGLD